MTPAKHSTTIEDVARLAGVSRAAVSKVIRDAYGVSPEMRAKVQAAIDELGYRPRAAARAMRGASYTLGVELPNILNGFFPKIIAGATMALADTQYQLILAPPRSDDDEGPEAIEALVDHQVDGVVTIGSRVSPAWLEELAQNTPLVAIGRHYDSAHFDTLVSDDAVGAALAVRHLYELGHRRIAHLTLAKAAVGSPHHVRLVAYKSVMAELGLTPEVILVDPGEEAARAASLKWLARADEPVAVFAAHDELALGVLRAVSELDLTPGQASVVGYDDTAIAEHPMISLTSVNQSGTQMGIIAVRLLLERIAGRTEHMHEVLPPKLQVRGSSAAPKARRTRGAAPRNTTTRNKKSPEAPTPASAKKGSSDV